MNEVYEAAPDSSEAMADDEPVRVERWIREQLARAGFSDVEATVAIAADLDWRALVLLRERGCPCRLALEIVR